MLCVLAETARVNMKQYKYLYVYLSNDGDIRIKTRASLHFNQETYIGKMKIEVNNEDN